MLCKWGNIVCDTTRVNIVPILWYDFRNEKSLTGRAVVEMMSKQRMHSMKQSKTYACMSTKMLSGSEPMVEVGNLDKSCSRGCEHVVYYIR